MAQDYDLMSQLMMMPQLGNGVLAPQMMAPTSLSQSSQVKIAEPIVAAFQRQQRFPTSAADFEELMKRRTAGLESQRAGLEDIEAQIGKLNQPTNEKNIAPILAISDFLAGTQYLKNYQTPAEKQKAAQAEALNLKLQLQKNKDALTDKEIDLYKAQYQDSFDREKLKAMTGLAQQKQEVKLLPGQEAADKEYGKVYAQWAGEGGYAGVEKQLGGLQNAISALKADPSLTGSWVEKLPGGSSSAVLARVKPEAFAIQQAVEQAIQNTLKSSLGSQFTAKEGEQLLARAYDPRLSAEENIKKVQAVIQEIETKARRMEESAKYFEQTGGTLKGMMPTTNAPQKQVGASPKVGEIVNGYMFKGGNPADKNSWEKK